MNLAKRYARKDSRELVEILESPKHFQPEALRVAEAELISRKLPDEAVHELAMAVNRERIADLLNRLDPLNDELKPPESYFLTRQEIVDLLKEEFAKFIKTKESFRFDVWKYAIGGF